MSSTQAASQNKSQKSTLQNLSIATKKIKKSYALKMSKQKGKLFEKEKEEAKYLINKREKW